MLGVTLDQLTPPSVERLTKPTPQRIIMASFEAVEACLVLQNGSATRSSVSSVVRSTQALVSGVRYSMVLITKSPLHLRPLPSGDLGLNQTR